MLDFSHAFVDAADFDAAVLPGADKSLDQYRAFRARRVAAWDLPQVDRAADNLFADLGTRYETKLDAAPENLFA
ncbi:hypothetical protein HKCCE2091_10120 [Rhodobacterales bacterium HKCCE2091]|nr:hypothetical protein [Rhodobacterales bacterium HKCCE2091]